MAFMKQINKLLSKLGKMKVKLTNTNLFILLLVALVGVCCVGIAGFKVMEGMTTPTPPPATKPVATGALEPGTGIPYNPSLTGTLPSGVNGIPASQIPEGDEDLYILKSQVVPPVCPKCPDLISKCDSKTSAEKCPPCPACARCPEPSFECKKVPNYNSSNSDIFPMPLLNDFSQF